MRCRALVECSGDLRQTGRRNRRGKIDSSEVGCWRGRHPFARAALEWFACRLERGTAICAETALSRKALGGLCGGLLGQARSEEHTSELQSQSNLVCRLLLEKK